MPGTDQTWCNASYWTQIHPDGKYELRTRGPLQYQHKYINMRSIITKVMTKFTLARNGACIGYTRIKTTGGLSQSFFLNKNGLTSVERLG